MTAAWEWEAGPLSGITDDAGRARRRAAEALRSGAAAEASVVQVVPATGTASMEGGYVPVPGTRQTGRRRGAVVRWGPPQPLSSR